MLLLLARCSGGTAADDAAIRAVMADQEAAWNQGDIPGFMEGYADTICFHSPRRVTCGKAAVTANYLRTYPDKATMGHLVFSVREVVPYKEAQAWVRGDWALHRAQDTVGGSYALLWVRQAEGWRIVRDHTY